MPISRSQEPPLLWRSQAEKSGNMIYINKLGDNKELQRGLKYKEAMRRQLSESDQNSAKYVFLALLNPWRSRTLTLRGNFNSFRCDLEILIYIYYIEAAQASIKS